MTEWIAFRISVWDTPFWALPNRREGRFNYAGKGETQYLALHPLTPWAEIARNERRVDREALDELRLPIWTARVFLDEDPLPIDFDSAPDWGLSPEQLVADDRSACQELGRRFREDPDLPDAIRVPSAALPGTENLVIFAPRIIHPYLLDPIDEQDVPASLVAERGLTPGMLEHLIRHYGDTHAGLEAWEAGEPFEFEEPPAVNLSS